VSSWLIANKFDLEAAFLEKLEQSPIVGLNKEFLRWMLSDGAGAFLLQNQPGEGISLKINWMESYSYAHEIETCMYAGGEKTEDGSITSWSDFDPVDWTNKSIFAIKQDVKILDKNITQKGADSLYDAIKKNNVNTDEIDYFLPHVSSYFFVQKLHQSIAAKGLNIPLEKWFLNLEKVGNVGSASIYLSLDELLNSGMLKPGNKIMLAVPESGRFSYAYAYLTVC
ncbi:MAG TPA: 3-oxoacyl-[acyl-carrier-protein] synthase III C-terminal domain-containing protein, partial [Flavobacteriaceae bacterium]|nr:3-oxoacyl-[acyl-carrier-protein] synthase III C-terminal domain-containing protein [Flavobacteriaceae bacterium]